MIYTIGEALIDFIPEEKGVGLKDVSSFRKVAGGAPANVACAVARLGGKSTFIGKLGDDPFGTFIARSLASCGVDTRRIVFTEKANTALAFVTLKADGNRDFLFYRNPSADMLLDESEINERWFHSDDILHFCSVDLIEAPVKYAHIKAIQSVKAQGGIISFDPNVRLPLWDNPADCRKTIHEFMPLAHILKISDEELEFVTGMTDISAAVSSLFVGDVRVVILTKGKEGAELFTPDFTVVVPGLPVSAIDTTGAGDAFVGSVLYKLTAGNLSLEAITKETALDLLTFANRVAAITTTKKGAIDSLPTLDEVSNFLDTTSLV